MASAQRIVLASRPVGEPKAENFRLEDMALPKAGSGQLLLRTIWLSLDPYMRGRMVDRKSYIAPFRLDAALEGAAVGIVEQSADPAFTVGDQVVQIDGIDVDGYTPDYIRIE